MYFAILKHVSFVKYKIYSIFQYCTQNYWIGYCRCGSFSILVLNHLIFSLLLVENQIQFDSDHKPFDVQN